MQYTKAPNINRCMGNPITLPDSPS